MTENDFFRLFRTLEGYYVLTREKAEALLERILRALRILQEESTARIGQDEKEETGHHPTQEPG